MKRFFKDWDELLTYEKFFSIIQSLFGVATIVLAIMWLCDIGNEIKMTMAYLSLSLELLCWAVSSWRRQRGNATLRLCLSVLFVLLCIARAIMQGGFAQ